MTTFTVAVHMHQSLVNCDPQGFSWGRRKIGSAVCIAVLKTMGISPGYIGVAACATVVGTGEMVLLDLSVLYFVRKGFCPPCL